MKLTDAIQRHASSSPHPYYTLEFFPPRTDSGFENLLARLSRLAVLHPVGLTITWGAGGSTKHRSLELAEAALRENDTTVLHLTCTNMERDMLDDALESAKSKGIHNILALRGDPPRGSEYWMPSDPRFQHASDLVSYIRERHGRYFCIGVAAYPDGHALDEEAELDHLQAKVNAGADFIITQLFYDADAFLLWLRKVRDRGISIPVIPGIMPIQSYASFLRMTKLCATRVPPTLLASLEPIRHDDQAVKDFGVELASEMIRTLTQPNSRYPSVQGVHFCTLNLERSVWLILEKLAWTDAQGNVIEDGRNRLIKNSDTPPPPSSLLITPHDASTSVGPPGQLDTVGVTSHTTSSLPSLPITAAASWDDFPNGRFGTADSPAFALTDPYDDGLAISPKEAQRLWGSPETAADLTALFLSHLKSTSASSSTPFSPNPLTAESSLVLPFLIELTSRGMWTVASQPAVDCRNSDDEIYGWGPKGGFVFQKPFCELFCDSNVLQRLKTKAALTDDVKYFAANQKGELITNMSVDEANAVTWGVFPGKEIAQPTIIERAAFLAWAEEAFGIWAEWALFHPPNSKTRQLLESVPKDLWLISVVHHDYKNPKGLWDFLLQI